ncbi:hypothetical protein GCM10023231_19820 [Olivibacter ginsenosidimutans]|uniref:DUF3857 domain-containing protein n=1 Tax=Olivibacter ginsenosidimutans TaxID=1176537 RepID=A0ABP9BAL1_9SPHI
MKLTLINLLTFLSFIIAPKFICAAHALPKLTKAIVPDWVKEAKSTNTKPANREIRDGYYISYYDYEVAVEQQVAYTKIVKNIVSESGIQNTGEIYINFNPSYQRLVLHSVNILRNGQIKDKLDLAAFKVMADEQELARSIYKGSYLAYLILEDLRVGDQVEYSYSLIGRNPIFGNRYGDDYYLQSGAPLGQIQVRVLANKNRRLHFKGFNGVGLPTKTEEGNQISYEWHATGVPALDYEDYQPSWYDNYRHVQCTEWSSWEEVASWAAKVNPVKANLSGDLLDKVNELLTLSKGNLYQFLASAIRLVQDDIRYMGVEVGEYSHRSNAPEKVFNQRYGDCKDKSLLLASILRYGGLKANLVLASTQLGRSLKNYLPTPDVFNHMIVYVEIDQRGQYVDPTISGQGGNVKELYVPDYGTCLLVSDEKTGLMREIGSSVSGKVCIEETYKILGRDSTSAILNVCTRYTGSQADANRSSFTDMGYAQLEKKYQEYYGKLYSFVRQEDSLQIKDDREKNELTVVEKYYVSGFLKRNEDTKVHQASFFANLISEQLPAITGNRRVPVATNYPLDMSYTIKVISPIGWNIREEKTFFDRKDYLFGSRTAVIGDTLMLDYQFAYHSPVVGLKELPQFASDLRELNDRSLSYSFYIPPSHEVSGISFLAVLYSIVVLIITVYWCWKRYKHKIERTLEDHFVYEKLGGWLVLLAISILFTALGQLVSLFTTGYFSSSLWEAMNLKGPEMAMAYKIMVVLEFTVTIFTGLLAAFTFYLMLKKRDIFPKTALLLYGILIVFNIVEIFAMYGFESLAANISQLIKNVIISSIWFIYLLKSTRVKETFVVGYEESEKRMESFDARSI